MTLRCDTIDEVAAVLEAWAEAAPLHYANRWLWNALVEVNCDVFANDQTHRALRGWSRIDAVAWGPN